MSSTQQLQLHIDAALAEQAAAVLAEMGFSLSDAVRLLLTRVAQDKRLPFEALVPNATTLAALEEVRSGNGQTITLDDIRGALRAPD